MNWVTVPVAYVLNKAEHHPSSSVLNYDEFLSSLRTSARRASKIVAVIARSLIVRDIGVTQLFVSYNANCVCLG